MTAFRMIKYFESVFFFLWNFERQTIMGKDSKLLTYSIQRMAG